MARNKDDITAKISRLLKLGIKITPEVLKGKFYVQINRNGLIIPKKPKNFYTKSKDVNVAMAKAINYEINKLDK